jgi:thiosulfate/3-mercaptopyruvate sulfurtransferase
VRARALALLICSSVAAAQSPRDALVVSTSWMASHLNDKNLVVLHVGPEFAKSHIPGARDVDFEALSVSDHSGKGLMLEMPPADKLRQALVDLGISNDSRIVVYFSDQDFLTPATRVVLTLDYAGLGKNTALLDGGLQAWTAAGNKTTRDASDRRKGTLAALAIKPIIVDAAQVRGRIGKAGVSIVDGRDGAFYDGSDRGGSHGAPHKVGHVAGAKSVPYSSITDDTGRLKSAEQLAALFAKAGVAPTDTIVGYCHIGQQATGMLFAARTLGHPVLLYDGSFEDWSRRDLPVEATTKR